MCVTAHTARTRHGKRAHGTALHTDTALHTAHGTAHGHGPLEEVILLQGDERRKLALVSPNDQIALPSPISFPGVIGGSPEGPPIRL